MKPLRLLLASTPWLTWALVAGCGEGGGYSGATYVFGGRGGTASPASGAGAGGLSAGVGGDGGMGAGSGGQGAEAGSGGAPAGNGGMAAGMAGMGGLAGDGSAGAAGSGITAGDGGGGAAGSGATSGAAGASGSGTGGFGGTTAGMSGAGGTAGGGGGSAGGGPLRTCGERCNTNTDCRVFSLDYGYVCNPSTHRCERFAEPCRNSVECLPANSFWIFACSTDMDCFFFSDDLCVDVGGVGRCARLAPSANGCQSPNDDEIMMPRFGAAGSVLVCGNASLTCSEGACIPGCSSNADCTPDRNGSVCDTNARLCRCVSDGDCGGPGVSRCNTASGRCECSDPRDCAEVPNANACTAGRCGCAAVSACNDERTFSGTTYVCE